MSVQSYRREQVVDLINSVISKVGKPHDNSQIAISRELYELKSLLEDLKIDLGSVSTQELSENHIPSAKDELDAVVKATEQATITIMESCDAMLHAVEGENIQPYIIKIYEACTFQDIAGQRISKVIKTLRLIDERLNGIISSLGNDNLSVNDPKNYPPESLLNGPALPEQGLSQEEIDRLLDGL